MGNSTQRTKRNGRCKMKIKVILKSKIVIEAETNIDKVAFQNELANCIEKKSIICLTKKSVLTLIPTDSIDYIKLEE